jgi:hypothetical protein
MAVEALHRSGRHDIASALQGRPEQRGTTVALLKTRQGVGPGQARCGNALTPCRPLTRHGLGLDLVVG